jgi:hypothetical protein
VDSVENFRYISVRLVGNLLSNLFSNGESVSFIKEVLFLNGGNGKLHRIHDFPMTFQLPRLKVVSLPPTFDIENDTN